jgi:hypothetical protein
MKKRWPLSVLFILGLFLAERASAMSSVNFGIGWDSVNSGGDDSSSSTNFALRDTLGEQATGYGSSTNYQVSAGYRVGDTSPESLSFDIRDSADTSNTNSCALGTLSAGGVSTCSYRLRISTSATNGFMALIQADHDFGTGSATMTNIGQGGSFVAGTEDYGLTLTGATAGGRDPVTGFFNQPVTNSANAAPFDFAAGPNPVPTSTAMDFMSYSDAFDAGSAPSLTNTSLVTHTATISSTTAAGLYSQTVTYLVTASF